MKTLIHIGYPKAASTWLQKSLFPAIQNYTLVPESEVAHNILKPDVFRFNPNEVLQYFSSEFNGNLLLSDERFLGSFNLGWNNGAYIKEFSIRLKKVFPDSTILLFIRKQPDIIASAYAQYIKDGGTISIDKYLHPAENFTFQNILKFSPEQLKYDSILRHYNELFKGKIKVFLYEDLFNDLPDFLDRFRQELDLKIDLSLVDESPKNIRYKRVILSIARCGNIFTRNGSLNKYYLLHIPGYHSVSKKILSALNRSSLSGKPASAPGILGEKNLNEIRSWYSESNQNLKEFISEDILKKYGYL